MILHPLHTDIQPPKEMNNPFDYEPHPLCQLAAEEVQRYIASQQGEWRKEVDRGKMFGVLVVAPLAPLTPHLSYLTAYSGQIVGSGGGDDGYFVPAVFDYLQPDGYFKTHEAEISRINHEIAVISTDERRQRLRQQLNDKYKEGEQAIDRYRKMMAGAKLLREQRRKSKFLSEDEKKALIKESQYQKAQLHRLRKQYAAEYQVLEHQLAVFNDKLRMLERMRKDKSRELQRWLFNNFQLLNAQGEQRSLMELFANTPFGEPPSGAGECCEPKLLQYAYSHNLKPLCMAMFWWGESPKSEVRHHLNYYPACSGKCKPILRWMIAQPPKKGGESNELDFTACLTNPRSGNTPLLLGGGREGGLHILYEDDAIIVISKPHGLLTIPGAETRLSVYTIFRKKYPDTDSPLIVHRLDMATSGLLIIAKTREAYRLLQQQFAEHTVRKRYRAILDGTLSPDIPQQGEIDLPLRPDLFDRPRQIVDPVHGKRSITHYTVDKVEGNNTWVSLYPLTGRTHQLRMHCAHQDGLNVPILGDTLYGNKSDRLYLHAEYIEFNHPVTGERVHFEDKAPWA